VGIGRGRVLFTGLLMLSVLDACDCCAVLSWSGESVWGCNVIVGFFLFMFRGCFCAIVAMIF
jgi:hypothetical protein